MDTSKREWFGPDFGGTYWLDGRHEEISAAVCLDPTGKTENYLWVVQIDVWGNGAADGSATTLKIAKAAARAALKAYEKQLDKQNKTCHACGATKKERSTKWH